MKKLISYLVLLIIILTGCIADEVRSTGFQEVVSHDNSTLELIKLRSNVNYLNKNRAGSQADFIFSILKPLKASNSSIMNRKNTSTERINNFYAFNTEYPELMNLNKLEGSVESTVKLPLSKTSLPHLSSYAFTN